MIRALRPGAAEVRAVAGDDSVDLKLVHPGGVFEGVLDGAELPLDYKLEVDYGEAGTVTIDGPYRPR